MSSITHYDGCWRDPKHHACAVREIERLHARLRLWRKAMAARDYVLCAHCGVKVFYDGSQKIRDSLEERWGDPSAPDFTVHMICPECLKKQEDEMERLRAEVVETTRRAGRLASLLRDVRADVKEIADQQTKRRHIDAYAELLAEIDEALEPK